RRDRRHVVMLGEPVPRAAELICALRKHERRGNSLSGTLCGSNGNEVENRELHSGVNRDAVGRIPAMGRTITWIASRHALTSDVASSSSDVSSSASSPSSSSRGLMYGSASPA